MRHLSRLNPEWACWTIFVDRLRHRIVRSGEVIRADDPGLYEAAALLGLGIEDDHGRPTATTLQMVSRQVPLRHPPDERLR